MSNVNISLSANTAQYVQRLKDAKTQTDRNLILMEKRIDQFAKDVNNNFTSVDGAINSMMSGLSKIKGGGYIAAVLALSVALVSAASGIHQLSKNALEAEKNLKKAAERSKMSVEEFRTLSMVTNTVGVDMEKMSDISKDVFDKLGDYVTAGSGGFKDFFDVVGTGTKLTAEELQNMSSDEVLGAVVSEMERVGATGSQMTFVLESIASDASDLLPLLKNNAKAMVEMRTRMSEIAHTGLIDPDVVVEMQVLDANWNAMWANMGTVAANKMDGMYTMLNSLIGKLNEFLVAADLDDAAKEISKNTGLALNGGKDRKGDKNYTAYKANTGLGLMQQEQEVLRLQRSIDLLAETGNPFSQDSTRNTIKHLEAELAVYEKSIEEKKKLDVKAKDDEEKLRLQTISRTKQAEAAGYASDSAIGDLDKAKAIEAARLIEIAQLETTEDIKAKLIAKAQHDREAAELAHYTKLAQIQLDAATTEQERIQAQTVLSHAQLTERQHNEQLSAEAVAGIKLNAERATFEALQNLRIEQAVTDYDRVAVEREVAQEMLQYDYENKLISHAEYIARKNEMDLQANEANAQMNSLVIQGAQDVFTQLENISKEGSAAQKIMFAANKALAIANAAIMMESNAINAKAAVANAAALTPDASAPARAELAATMSRVSDSIRIGMMVGTTLGQFHSGSDEVDQTGSYILKKGERVVQETANKDLTSFLSSNGSSKGQVKVDAPLNIQGDTTISEAKLMSMMATQRSQIAKLVKLAQRESPSLR